MKHQVTTAHPFISKAGRCLLAVILVLGLMPALALAEPATNQTPPLCSRG